LLQNMVLSITR